MRYFSIRATTAPRSASSAIVFDVVRHDFVDPAGVGVNVILGERAGAEQEFDPARASALGSGLRAAQKIALGDDARQVPVTVDHRQAADPVVQHQAQRFEDRGIRRSASRIEASGVMVITCWVITSLAFIDDLQCGPEPSPSRVRQLPKPVPGSSTGIAQPQQHIASARHRVRRENRLRHSPTPNVVAPAALSLA
jgi:hypothetical protein